MDFRQTFSLCILGQKNASDFGSGQICNIIYILETALRGRAEAQSSAYIIDVKSYTRNDCNSLQE